MSPERGLLTSQVNYKNTALINNHTTCRGALSCLPETFESNKNNTSNVFLAHQMSTCKMTVRLSSVPGSKVCSWVNHRVQPFSDTLCL